MTSSAKEKPLRARQGRMALYRCYLLNQDGVVSASEDFEAQDDAEAQIASRRLRVERQAAGLELWQRPRMIYSERPEAAGDRASGSGGAGWAKG
jgi:hypothetical protein